MEDFLQFKVNLEMGVLVAHADGIRCLLFTPPSDILNYQPPSSSASLFSLAAVRHHFTLPELESLDSGGSF